jgi:hypothetical protein
MQDASYVVVDVTSMPSLLNVCTYLPENDLPENDLPERHIFTASGHRL